MNILCGKYNDHQNSFFNQVFIEHLLCAEFIHGVRYWENVCLKMMYWEKCVLNPFKMGTIIKVLKCILKASFAYILLVPFWVPFDFALLIYKLMVKRLIKIMPLSVLNVALCTTSENIRTSLFQCFYISIVNSQLFDSCCSDLWFQFSSFYYLCFRLSILYLLLFSFWWIFLWNIPEINTITLDLIAQRLVRSLFLFEK